MSANRDEDRIEPAGFFLCQNIIDSMVQCDFDADIFNSLDLGAQLITRHTVRRNTEMNHPAGYGAGLTNFDVVAHPYQMVGS